MRSKTTRASGIAGAAGKGAHEQQSTPRFIRSLSAQLNLLVAIFLILPVLLYSVFSTIDRDRRGMLLDTVRDNGLLIGKALQPLLQSLPPDQFGRLQVELARFGSDQRSIKLLYKPSAAAGSSGFFYVASAPAVPLDHLAAERQRLVDLGILGRLAQSCGGNTPLAERVAVPDQGTEILTSVTPVSSAAGCWVVVIASDARPASPLVDERAYWQRPAMRLVLGLYVAMAVVAMVIFARVRSALSRLRQAAQSADTGVGFERSVSVPEFIPMAREFDRMVDRLRNAAQMLRQAAEDNAHAFKGPLATIRQSLEPFAAQPSDPERLQAAGTAIAASLDRLDGLVRSARRLDTATAEMLDGVGHVFDASQLVEAFAAEYRLMLGSRAGRLDATVTPGIAIRGQEDLIEIILENLVDNALGFCPDDGKVTVALERQGDDAVLSVADGGPGVDPALLDRIFDRYFSLRPQANSTAAGGDSEAQQHFGIGLWLVRQHAIILGGRVEARNRETGGLIVRVHLPVAAPA